jgi:hypothetical protein
MGSVQNLLGWDSVVNRHLWLSVLVLLLDGNLLVHWNLLNWHLLVLHLLVVLDGRLLVVLDRWLLLVMLHRWLLVVLDGRLLVVLGRHLSHLLMLSSFYVTRFLKFYFLFLPDRHRTAGVGRRVQPYPADWTVPGVPAKQSALTPSWPVPFLATCLSFVLSSSAGLCWREPRRGRPDSCWMIC